MEDYHVSYEIGRGTFGTVYAARRKNTGTYVAIKKITRPRSDNEAKILEREIGIMKDLHHENIVHMYDSFKTKDEVVIVTELAINDLGAIFKDEPLPEEAIQPIACQIVCALHYLHARRIVHRDLKSANILVFPRGVVKLCDFGLSRTMSPDTLILDSIKGTPLYMPPEVMQSTPAYNHTMDLWSLGVILYELFTGYAPFEHPNSHALRMIIAEQEPEWPQDMSADFVDMLRGLLQKKPDERLQWPALLDHPFVAGGVTVEAESEAPEYPSFTDTNVDEQKMDERKKTPNSARVLYSKQRKILDKLFSDRGSRKETLAAAADMEGETSSSRIASAEVDEVQGPRSLGPGSKNGHQCQILTIERDSHEVLTLDSVELLENSIEERWDDLCSENDTEHFLTDSECMAKVMMTLYASSEQMLDANMDGANLLRKVLQLLQNMASLKCDPAVKEKFLTAVDSPTYILAILEKALHNNTVKEQAWYQLILIDLVNTLKAYLCSDVISVKTSAVMEAYQSTCVKILELIPELLDQSVDRDLRLRETSLQCVLCVCEAIKQLGETNVEEICGISEHARIAILEAILTGCVPNDTWWMHLHEEADGKDEDAKQKMERIITLCLKSLSNLIDQPNCTIPGMNRMAETFGELLSEERMSRVTEDFFLLLDHDKMYESILMIVYVSAQSSVSLCTYLANHSLHISTLLSILDRTQEDQEEEVSTTAPQMILHMLSVLILQLNDVPEQVKAAVPVYQKILHDSHHPECIAPCAVLVNLLSKHGVRTNVDAEAFIVASVQAMRHLDKVSVPFPPDTAMLDGIVTILLKQIKWEVVLPVAGLCVEKGLWSQLWSQVSQALDVVESNLEMASGNTAESLRLSSNRQAFSVNGLIRTLIFTVEMFIKEKSQVLPSLSDADGVIMQCLIRMLDPNFLQAVDTTTCISGSPVPLPDFLDYSTSALSMVHWVAQVCCIPFCGERDPNKAILRCFKEVGLVDSLLSACVRYVEDTHRTFIPLSFLCRLVCEDEELAEQFAASAEKEEAVMLLMATLKDALSESGEKTLARYTIPALSQLARISDGYVPLIQRIIEGVNKDYQLLNMYLRHNDSTVRSSTCNMVGNMFGSSFAFLLTLAERPQLVEALVINLSHNKPNVRKNAAYALGNMTYEYHEALCEPLELAVGSVVSLIQDPAIGTRKFALTIVENLCWNYYSDHLCASLLRENAVVSILEAACQDKYVSTDDDGDDEDKDAILENVREFALDALRVMNQHDVFKKELRKREMHTTNKLKNIINKEGGLTGKAPDKDENSPQIPRSTGASRIAVLCWKLIVEMASD